MLVLENGDKLRGDASAATVVDFTIHGIIGSTPTQLADGQLAATIGDLYTSASIVIVASITLVNTDTVARTVNLYLTPSGGTARRLIAKDLSLAAGYSLMFDGNKFEVIDTNGQIITTRSVPVVVGPATSTDNAITRFNGTTGASVQDSAAILDDSGNITLNGSAKLIGGTATTADLTLQTTSGVGASGADMHFLVGNAGATEAMTILNSGYIGIGQTNPLAFLHIKGQNIANRGQLSLEATDYTQITLYAGATTGTHMGAQIYYDVSGKTTNIQSKDGSTGAVSILALNPTGGNVGIGTDSPSALLDVNSDILRLRTAKTPASSGAAGNAGDICWDASYIYVCTATNTWERAAIATW